MQRWGDLFDSQAGSSVISCESRQLEDCFFSSMACVGVEATATCSHGPAGMTAISFADRRLTDPSSATSVGPAALLPCCERPGPLPPPPPPAACPCTGPTTSPHAGEGLGSSRQLLLHVGGGEQLIVWEEISSTASLMSGSSPTDQSYPRVIIP